MDFFKFKSATDATTLDQGEQINGIEKAMWVERYAEPGEFSFEAKLSSGLIQFLPVDTLISHADSLDIMIVENHEIDDKEDEDPTIAITGRSFVSYLENRIVGTNWARTHPAYAPYILTANYSWNQIVSLINDHIGNVSNPNDNLTQVVATSVVSGTAESIERTVPPDTVWKVVSELLKINDLGIKIIRKNTFGVGVAGNTAFVIHAGVNHSSDVFFSWKTGDISSANYLFTNKNRKNSAMVKGQYIYVIVDEGPTKYNRRMMFVDASDIDGHLNVMDAGEISAAITAMTTRGQQALKAQYQITISQADVASTSMYQYRRDYNIGDLISLDGNFGQIAVMRVTEYAEIQDENGESGHPTLSIVGE